MLRTVRAAGALMLFLGAGLLATDCAVGEQLSARAEPDRVAAGSAGGAAIIVEVRTDSGELAKDGTQVQFASTLGTITPVAETWLISPTRKMTRFSSSSSSTVISRYR